MPPPVPVPSKAAIHALRGIAFGTSCAIGVIVEDRRRRISILRTAVSNGEKIKAAKRYHGVSAVATPHEEPSFLEGDDSHRPPQSDRPRRYMDFTSLEEEPQENSTQSPTSSIVSDTSSEMRNTFERKSNIKLSIPSKFIHESSRMDLAPAKKVRIRNEFADAVKVLLKNKEEDGLDRALTKFFDVSRLYYSFRDFDEDWLTISAELSRACQAKSRLDDAAKVLTTTIDAGPLDEDQFYAHDPLPILNFYLHEKHGDGRCPPETIAAATHIFLARFKDQPRLHTPEMDCIGRELFTYTISMNQPTVLHDIYWRIFGSAVSSTDFTGWVIREFYQYKDYRSVIRYFLLNYSKMSPTKECYDQTVDCVISSVENLKALKARQVIEALGRMEPPPTVRLHTRWVMKSLHAFWRRDEDFTATKEFFDDIVSWGVMDKISHPQGVYCAMVEISVRAKQDEIARSYSEVLIHKFPRMFYDIRLRGLIALAAANAGNWDAVFETFTEMQALKAKRDKEYSMAFIMVLKVFAQTHPAAEVRDFVSSYTTDLGVRLHRYAVTLVANKFGECRDMTGFISWLAYCCKVGFALDSGICNSILYNCWSVFKLSYPELLELYSKLRQLGPSLTDDVTRRILSQASNTASKGGRRISRSRGLHLRTAMMNELAYRGKAIDPRDVFEAMNRELQLERPATAMRIYKQALSSGMPSCEHCLRLAVVASSKSPKHGFDCAMALIRTAYSKGTDITSAVAMFIKLRLEQLQANAHDLQIHMRNLIGQFEAANIIIQPGVIIKMAIMVIDVGQFEKGLSLCTFAMNQHGFKNFAFSRQCIRAMLIVYLRLRDVQGMKKLCRDILESEYATDKSVLSYLRSTRRLAVKYKDASGNAILDILEGTIGGATKQRAETRAAGAKIAQETLRIMQDAVSSMQEGLKPNTSNDPIH
ncbi:uncharacterized protein GGS22DRAFT_150896 [Annulohypoxylon maeteangense]|uniref:uncharacterized protein n=1 Tax=Annulohypoxylon maeteangense TaxID=1927788 RepID=UPI002007D8BC|nr:uncharacterized protein GGS22DRAFT_150896 [Annulohypoxylon maeteangense]KAI0890436.1 hypothetical protein GGS22DRAFT_150896 [Annulohypoxylon maeteangense]